MIKALLFFLVTKFSPLVVNNIMKIMDKEKELEYKSNVATNLSTVDKMNFFKCCGEVFPKYTFLPPSPVSLVFFFLQSRNR